MERPLEHRFLIEVLERFKKYGHNEGIIPVTKDQLFFDGLDFPEQLDSAIFHVAASFDVELQTQFRIDLEHDCVRWLFAYRILEFT